MVKSVNPVKATVKSVTGKILKTRDKISEGKGKKPACHD